MLIGQLRSHETNRRRVSCWGTHFLYLSNPPAGIPVPIIPCRTLSIIFIEMVDGVVADDDDDDVDLVLSDAYSI